MRLKVWFAETRPPFLLLSVVLVSLGTSVAFYEGFFFNPSRFVLALVGLLLLHISVNVLNDYFDFKAGIDLETKRTPFSGGSGILPAGLLNPASVYKLGVVCLLLGLSIGGYFLAAVGWLLLPLILLGALSVYFYNIVFARRMLGEAFAGLGLGALPVLGAYFVQSSGYSLPAVAAAIPPLILTHNLLFLNEFPDVQPDEKGGRRNIVIALGEEKASKLYAALTTSVYSWITASTLVGLMPLPTLISLATIPFAVKAIKGALKLRHSPMFVSALAANVMVVLATQALMAIGFLVASYLKTL